MAENGDLNGNGQRYAGVRPIADRAPSAPLLSAWSPSGERSCRLVSPFITVGSRPDNDLVLDGAGVGGYHLRIVWNGGQATLIDLGSSGIARIGGRQLARFGSEPWDGSQTLYVGPYQLSLATGATDDSRGAGAATPTNGQPANGSRTLELRIEDGREAMRVIPGQPAALRVTIINRSVDTEVRLSASGVPPGWLHLPEHAVEVATGQKDLSLLIQAPAEPTSRVGPHQVTIHAESGDGGEAMAVARCFVEPFFKTRLEIRPPRAGAFRQQTYSVVVHNQGNYANSYRLSAEVPSDQLSFEFDDTRLDVPAGGREEAVLHVSARPRIFGGEPTHMLKVSAEPETQKGDARSEQIQFTHLAYFAGWRLVAAALVFFVLLPLLVYNWLIGVLPGSYEPWARPLGGCSLCTPVPPPTPPGATAQPTRQPPTATPNATEAAVLAANATAAAWLQADDDFDRLNNATEQALTTDSGQRDTDGDGLEDAAELEWSLLGNGTPADPRKVDSDGDGLSDGDELGRGLNPGLPDSDGDGTPDAADPDALNKPTLTPTPTNTPTSTPTSTPTPTPTRRSGAGGGVGGSDGADGAGGSGGADGDNGAAGGTPTATPTLPPNRPPFIGVPSTQSVREETAALITGISISDPDAGSNNLRVVLQALNGTLIITDSGTTRGGPRLEFEVNAGALQNLLSTVTFQGDKDFAGSASILITADDLGNTGSGGARTTSASVPISVQNVNDPPTWVTTSTLRLSVREGGSASIDATMLSATDVDNDAGELIYTLVQAPTHGNLLAAGNRVVAGGNFTQEDVDDGRVSYQHTDDNPAPDEFVFTVKDGGDTRLTQQFSVEITQNTSPELDLNGADPLTNNYTATLNLSDTTRDVLIVPASVRLDDDGQTLSQVKITLVDRPDGARETLLVDTVGTNIRADYADGVLTLSRTDTVANYLTVLKRVKYQNLANDPNFSDREITFVVRDAEGKSSATVMTIVDLKAPNRPPEFVLGDDVLETYVENDDPQRILPNADVDDNDDTFDNGRLVVTVAGNLVSDILGIRTGTFSVVGTDVKFSGTTIGTLEQKPTEPYTLTISLNEEASLDVTRELVQAIVYSSTLETLAAEDDVDRTVSFTLVDASGEATQRELTFRVQGANDAPGWKMTNEYNGAVIRNNPGDQNVSFAVSSIIQTNTITDVDAGALQGIAIVAANSGGGGVWEYKLPSGDWTFLGTVNNGSVLLLEPSAQLRFEPYDAYTYAAQPSITVLAWDQSRGTSGSRVDPGDWGPTSAFSKNDGSGRVKVNVTVLAP